MKVVISENQLKKLVNIISEGSDNKKNVLFVGDSLSNAPGYTWNYFLADKHPEWNSTHATQGGIRTNEMITKLLEPALNKKKYDLVFIWGGTNDAFSQVSNSTAINNLQTMADKVIAQGGKPIIFAGYDVKSVMTDKSLRASKDKNGNIIVDKKGMMNLRDEKMIPLQNEIERGIRGAQVISRIKDSSIEAGDGVHIGPIGHRLIADYVDSKLDTITRRIEKIDNKPELGSSWVQTIKNYLGGLYKSFFGSGKTLTNKLISDLENLKENKILTKKEFLLQEGKTLQYEKGFIEYNPKVEPLQVSLQLLGYSLPNWGVDGKFGPETKKAITDFQIDNNIKPTGKVTPDVASKLINKIKSKNITDEDFAKLNVTKTEKYNEKDYKSKMKNVELVGMDFEDFALKTHGVDFLDRVIEIGNEVGLDYKLILATMYFESKMKPSAVNSATNATGLIQFMPFVASNMGTSVESLRNMDALSQLDYVEKFYNMNRRFIPRIQSPEEAYFLVFYPAAIGKSDDFILGSEVSPERVRMIRKQNSPGDVNSDGQISKGEIKQIIRKKWGIG